MVGTQWITLEGDKWLCGELKVVWGALWEEVAILKAFSGLTAPGAPWPHCIKHYLQVIWLWTDAGIFGRRYSRLDRWIHCFSTQVKHLHGTDQFKYMHACLGTQVWKSGIELELQLSAWNFDSLLIKNI
jgi:hypothetical protein